MKVYYYGGELYHHGILGQKWGVRRYQNPDGTLTDAGKKRYSKIFNINEDTLSEKIEVSRATGIPLKKLAQYQIEDERVANRVIQAFSGMPVANLTALAVASGNPLSAAVVAPIAAPLSLITLFAHKRNKDIRKLTDEQLLNLMREKSDSSEKEIRKLLNIYKEWEPGDDAFANEMIRESHAYDMDKYAREKIDNKVKKAMSTDKFDMEFLERGLDTDQRTGAELSGKKLEKAYKKYLVDKYLEGEP